MDDNSIDTLREVLQDMTMNIELLSSGQRSGEALISFIEEMLVTVEAWAAKYNVLVPPLKYSKPTDLTPHSDTDYSQLVANPKLHATASQGMDKHVLSLDLEQEAKSVTLDSGQHQGDTNAALINQPVLSNGEMEGPTTQKEQDVRLNAQIEDNICMVGKPSSTVTRRTRSQDLGSFVADPNDSQHNDSASKHINTSNFIDDGDGKAASKQEMGEVIESPDWLPKGWLTEVKTRNTGGSAGAKDKYFVDPNSQRRFRSKREVLAFLNTTTKRKRGRPRKSESVSGEFPPEKTQEESAERARDDATQQEAAQSVSEAAVIVTSSLISNQIPPPVITSAVTTLLSGSSGNVSEPAVLATSPLISIQIPPPVITSAVTALVSSSTLPHPPPPGQPSSEWLVYESLASLPFPILEHNRRCVVGENNASMKGPSAACNTTPPLWPWMIPGHPGSLKKPSKADEEEPSEKENAASTCSAGGSVPAAEEAVPKRPKKAARKNAS